MGRVDDRPSANTGKVVAEMGPVRLRSIFSINAVPLVVASASHVRKTATSLAVGTAREATLTRRLILARPTRHIAVVSLVLPSTVVFRRASDTNTDRRACQLRALIATAVLAI